MSTSPCGTSRERSPGCRCTGCSDRRARRCRRTHRRGCIPSNATYVEEALAYRDRGFAGYKLHPPTQRRRMPVGGPPGPVSIQEDIDTCAAVRDVVGRRLLPDARLRVGVLLQGGPRRRLRHRGCRLPLVRGSARRRGSRRVRAAEAAPVDPDRRDRDHRWGSVRAATVDRRSRHRRAARRRRDQGRHHGDDEDRGTRRGEPSAVRGARRLQRDRQPRDGARGDGDPALLDVRGARAPRARLVRPRPPLLRAGRADHDRR